MPARRPVSRDREREVHGRGISHTHFQWEVLASCCSAPASSRSECFRDTTAGQGNSTPHPEGSTEQPDSVHAPERNSCIGDSGVWAPRHWSIVAEDGKMGSSKPPTRSVRSRPRSRHFPVVLLYLATGGRAWLEGRKKIDLLIHTSLKISCTRVMARATRYQRHIDNSTKHCQL